MTARHGRRRKGGDDTPSASLVNRAEPTLHALAGKCLVDAVRARRIET
ncbi:hypothetical protein [Nostoc sp. CHAB 5715]|nr:hypothetical protein [Nostoc sp. CHAB 5715]MCC5626529.1 hypothetical protein [Nostoc sp. CHAB 5715]